MNIDHQLSSKVFDLIPKSNKDQVTFDELKKWRENGLRKMNLYPQVEVDGMQKDNNILFQKTQNFFNKAFKGKSKNFVTREEFCAIFNEHIF